MLRKTIAVMLMLFCVLAVYGQTKPRLGILPFTGGPAGDGETIATLLSYQSDITQNFTVMPRPNSVNAMVVGEDFQMLGYPDSDSLARIGRTLNADFIVSGFIRYLGGKYMVLTHVVNVNTYELLSGFYEEYQRIQDFSSVLPHMADAIIKSTQRDTVNLPKLTIAPFVIAKDGTNVQEAETLSQLLAIEIENLGKYSILPRTSTVEAAKRDLDYRTGGFYTPEEEARALGWAVNAGYVLKTEVYNVGAARMFAVSIINTNTGELVAEGSRLYRSLSDGVPMMPELAQALNPGAAIAVAPPPPLVPEPESFYTPEPEFTPPPPEPEPIVVPRPPVPQPSPEPIQVTDAPSAWEPDEPTVRKPRQNARLWTIGASVGSSFAVPWLIATVHGTIAPFNYFFIELGCDAGFITRSEDVDFYYSIFPFGHLAFFLPFSKGGWYIGAGAGYMMAFYTFPEGKIQKNILTVNATTGFNLFNFIDISYTLRLKPDFTNFDSMSHKASIGFTYRF